MRLVRVAQKGSVWKWRGDRCDDLAFRCRHQSLQASLERPERLWGAAQQSLTPVLIYKRWLPLVSEGVKHFMNPERFPSLETLSHWEGRFDASTDEWEYWFKTAPIATPKFPPGGWLSRNRPTHTLLLRFLRMPSGRSSEFFVQAPPSARRGLRAAS